MSNDEYRAEQAELRQHGLQKRHNQRLENAAYTAAEVKVLTEAASKVAFELGRREAQAECAAILEERASQRAMRGTEAGVVLLGMADTIRHRLVRPPRWRRLHVEQTCDNEQDRKVRQHPPAPDPLT